MTWALQAEAVPHFLQEVARILRPGKIMTTGCSDY